MALRVLWFEISEPAAYAGNNKPVNGWQDALSYVLRRNSDIDLYVAFEGHGSEKVVDGVNYIPIDPGFSIYGKLRSKLSWGFYSERVVPKAVSVVERIKPDIIHVFGSEYCWGQIVKYTNIPVVIHMQGSIPSYINALYPPGYSFRDEMSFSRTPAAIWRTISNNRRNKTWVDLELDNLKAVNNYMGRTEWDHSIVRLFNPSATYFYCSEMLRPIFYSTNNKWQLKGPGKLILLTVGCGTLWKGLDTIMRTAKILKSKGVDFEWNVVGKMFRKEYVEYKEKDSFKNNNINILGFQSAEQLVVQLVKCSFVVHTAYIDNSPNSICEAQYLGCPVISTNVGGISSLIDNDVDGLLVPANDPYLLAYRIIALSNDKAKQVSLSENALISARKRHNPETILHDLLECYNAIIQKHNNFIV